VQYAFARLLLPMQAWCMAERTQSHGTTQLIASHTAQVTRSSGLRLGTEQWQLYTKMLCCSTWGGCHSCMLAVQMLDLHDKCERRCPSLPTPHTRRADTHHHRMVYFATHRSRLCHRLVLLQQVCLVVGGPRLMPQPPALCLSTMQACHSGWPGRLVSGRTTLAHDRNVHLCFLQVVKPYPPSLTGPPLSAFTVPACLPAGLQSFGARTRR
jgi:hypothetical protein